MSLNRILIGGAIGGVLPTLAKVASTYVTVPSTPLPELGLIYGILLFAIIGAAIAFATGQDDVRQALIAGIAAPGIITNLLAGAAQNSGQTSTSPNPTHGAIFEIIGTAFGQPANNGSGSIAGTRKIVIDPKVSGGLPSNTNIPLTAEFTGQNNQKKTVEIGNINSLSSQTTYTVPNSIDQLKIGGKTVPLAGSQTTIQLDVLTAPTSGSDFLWALGAQRNYKIETITPKVK